MQTPFLVLWTISFYLVIILLISLVEMAVLQLLHWGSFKKTLTTSLLLNFISSIFSIPAFILIPEYGSIAILVAWMVSILVEWGILSLIKKGAVQENFRAAFFCNTASYLILLVPAYYFAA